MCSLTPCCPVRGGVDPCRRIVWGSSSSPARVHFPRPSRGCWGSSGKPFPQTCPVQPSHTSRVAAGLGAGSRIQSPPSLTMHAQAPLGVGSAFGVTGGEWPDHSSSVTDGLPRAPCPPPCSLGCVCAPRAGVSSQPTAGAHTVPAGWPLAAELALCAHVERLLERGGLASSPLRRCSY